MNKTVNENMDNVSVDLPSEIAPLSSSQPGQSSPSSRSPAEIAALEQIRKGSEAAIRAVAEQQKTPWTMEEAKEQFRRNSGTSTETTPPPSSKK